MSEVGKALIESLTTLRDGIAAHGVEYLKTLKQTTYVPPLDPPSPAPGVAVGQSEPYGHDGGDYELPSKPAPAPQPAHRWHIDQDGLASAFCLDCGATQVQQHQPCRKVSAPQPATAFDVSRWVKRFYDWIQTPDGAHGCRLVPGVGSTAEKIVEAAHAAGRATERERAEKAEGERDRMRTERDELANGIERCHRIMDGWLGLSMETTAIDPLDTRMENLNLADEKRRRVYYQDIVYAVCNTLDRINRSQGIMGEAGSNDGRIVCGTIEHPSTKVQDLMRVVEKRLDTATADRDRAVGELDAARRTMREDIRLLAEEVRTWRTSEGVHSVRCQGGENDGMCPACEAFARRPEVRDATDKSGAIQRAIDEEERAFHATPAYPDPAAAESVVAHGLARAMYETFRDNSGNEGWPHWPNLRDSRRSAWIIAATYASGPALAHDRGQTAASSALRAAGS